MLSESAPLEYEAAQDRSRSHPAVQQGFSVPKTVLPQPMGGKPASPSLLIFPATLQDHNVKFRPYEPSGSFFWTCTQRYRPARPAGWRLRHWMKKDKWLMRSPISKWPCWRFPLEHSAATRRSRHSAANHGASARYRGKKRWKCR